MPERLKHDAHRRTEMIQILQPLHHRIPTLHRRRNQQLHHRPRKRETLTRLFIQNARLCTPRINQRNALFTGTDQPPVPQLTKQHNIGKKTAFLLRFGRSSRSLCVRSIRNSRMFHPAVGV